MSRIGLGEDPERCKLCGFWSGHSSSCRHAQPPSPPEIPRVDHVEIPLPVDMIDAAAIEAREHDTTVSTDDEGWYWTCTCDFYNRAAPGYDEAETEARHHVGTSILAAALRAGETRTEHLCRAAKVHEHRCPTSTHVRTVHIGPWVEVPNA